MNPLSETILMRALISKFCAMRTAAPRAGWLLAVLLPLAGLRAQSNYATPYTFTTLAGVAGGPGSTDGTGRAARFNRPGGVAVDGAGNVYVADVSNHTIRKITAAGVVTTLAGTALSAGSADGTGAAARFNQPNAVAVDGSGNVYVADTYNHAIRKITAGGVVTTLAGSLGNPGSADGAGSAARFYYPNSVAVDGSGNVYVADTLNHTIRVISSGGMVTTLAGLAGNSGSTDATGSNARFGAPTGVTVDGSGNVYVAEYLNHTVRKITSGGVVTTLAGAPGTHGSADGTGSAARFYQPLSVAVDGAGNVYVADTSNTIIRKVTAGGVVTTLAGTAGSFGSNDGTGSAAQFNSPAGVAVDGAGNVYVGDSFNHAIRKITSGGVVTTFAGAASHGSSDGTGNAAQFYNPQGVAVDAAGNAYVVDTANETIRKITAGGVVTTLAGTAGSVGSTDGTGGAARFNTPYGIAADGSGNLYVADYGNNLIRKITAGGVVTTLAGTAGSSGSADGTGSAARFDGPSGVAVDGSGNVYVADTNSSIIRKITPGGVVTTLAGTAYDAGRNDGTGSAAQFNSPFGVGVDGSGNVYVADTNNSTIRKIAPGGVVTTLAGSYFQGADDGAGSAALFSSPQGVAVDGLGNLYIADAGNNSIRRLTFNGVDWVVTTLAGSAPGSGSADGTGSTAQFFSPGGVAADAAGHLYVADTGNNAIRKGLPLLPGDFNGDDKPDILWQNSGSGDRGFWLMNHMTFSSWQDIGVITPTLKVVGTADFNGDGKSDLVWENTATGKRVVWFMNGTTFISSFNLGIVSTDWHIAAVGDFNGDGHPDILWENTVTGDRGFWLMNGTTFASWVGIGVIPTEWRIVAVADFDGDAHPDILWENTLTGDRYFWLMNGTSVSSAVYFGTLSTAWHIAAVGDYNGDGHPDILWENTATGDRYFSLLNGTTPVSWQSMGIVSTDWRIAP